MYEPEAQQTADHQTRLAGLRKSLNVDNLKHDIAEVEASMAVPGFWDDSESAQKTVQRLKALKSVVGAPDELAREIEDAATRKVAYDESACIECLACIRVCPYGACTSAF